MLVTIDRSYIADLETDCSPMLARVEYAILYHSSHLLVTVISDGSMSDRHLAARNAPNTIILSQFLTWSDRRSCQIRAAHPRFTAVVSMSWMRGEVLKKVDDICSIGAGGSGVATTA